MGSSPLSAAPLGALRLLALGRGRSHRHLASLAQFARLAAPAVGARLLLGIGGVARRRLLGLGIEGDGGRALRGLGRLPDLGRGGAGLGALGRRRRRLALSRLGGLLVRSSDPRRWRVRFFGHHRASDSRFVGGGRGRARGRRRRSGSRQQRVGQC